jgi:hypothetical protein
MVNRGPISRLNTIVANDADKNVINILFSISQILSRYVKYNLSTVKNLFDKHETTSWV